MSCVRLLKKFLKLLVHRERADYFFDRRTALGVVLVCLRITEIDDNSIACTSRTNPPKRCTVAATPGVWMMSAKRRRRLDLSLLLLRRKLPLAGVASGKRLTLPR
jgi:hypothetical protein